MAQTKDERLAKVHERALQRFDQIQSAVFDERIACLSDRRFYSIAGAQWEGALGDQFANKPRFEVNKVGLAVLRVINEYRNNRITVAFTSKDGSPDDEFADTCDGLYRADEKACTADEAYDNAFEEGVGGGFGAWRVKACYEDEEDEEDDRQRVRIEPIFDADSCVFFDLDAKRQDKADARFCFVLTAMTPQAYTDEYDEDPSTWPKSVQMSQFDWSTPDVTYVAEYYEVEEKTEIIHIYRSLDEKDMRVPDSELKDDPTKAETLEATGFREVRQKRVKRQKVHKYLMSGMSILEDEGYIAGRHIPIVPFFGKRWVVDGIERCMGLVRPAKDAQRLVNMLMSWLAELAARFDAEKPILTPEQIQGHAKMWAEDNVTRFPYLLINSMTDAEGNPIPSGPVAYTRAPNIPPAMAALMQLAEQSLQDMLGNQQEGETLQPNLSGKAVELIQNRLSMLTFIYTSNLAKAHKRSGEIWLSIMRDIAVEESRKMKTVSPDGETSTTTINEPMIDEESQGVVIANDFSKATFDVDVDVGPSSASQRAATVRALTGLASISADPETQQALILASIANVEGEGLAGVRDWARKKSIRIGTVKPTDEEVAELQQQMQNQPPDPQAVYLQSAAAQAEADAALARGKTVQTLADADLKKAQTDKTIAETSGVHPDQQIKQGDQVLKAADQAMSAQQAAAQHELQARQAEHAMSQPQGEPK
jgi:hypothetical protein